MARSIRSFTLEKDISRQLDENVIRGERSQFVNELLRAAFEDRVGEGSISMLSIVAAMQGFGFMLMLTAGRAHGLF